MQVNSSRYKDPNAQGVNRANLKEKCPVLVVNTQQQAALYLRCSKVKRRELDANSCKHEKILSSNVPAKGWNSIHRVVNNKKR